ncbi:MAG: hypothetical protein KKB51_19000, partial [Candidatus Riflebacteria bacterium]|nr:hypothetical protein [Candidatus Riflebacteria bacterium]
CKPWIRNYRYGKENNPVQFIINLNINRNEQNHKTWVVSNPELLSSYVFVIYFGNDLVNNELVQSRVKSFVSGAAQKASVFPVRRKQ